MGGSSSTTPVATRRVRARTERPSGEIKQVFRRNTIMAHVTMKRGRSLIAIAAAVAHEQSAYAAAEDQRRTEPCGSAADNDSVVDHVDSASF
jgi:hypothetical protein